MTTAQVYWFRVQEAPNKFPPPKKLHALVQEKEVPTKATQLENATEAYFGEEPVILHKGDRQVSQAFPIIYLARYFRTLRMQLENATEAYFSGEPVILHKGDRQVSQAFPYHLLGTLIQERCHDDTEAEVDKKM
jgi:hypothetical protein